MALPILSQPLNIARVQSPSSINTFRQCPRKYYYNYIAKLPTTPSIHLVRGKCAHSALEDFFTLNPDVIHAENYAFELQTILIELFRKHWQKSGKQLSVLRLSEGRLQMYFVETIKMLKNWVELFTVKLEEKMEDMAFDEAFRSLTPITEKMYAHKELGVRGFVDAIHEEEDGVTILDYKTSSKSVITEDYRLQLGIYALMYHKTHGEMPSKVGVHFLRTDEQLIDVDQELLDFAYREILFIHENTQSKDISEYQRKPSGLCQYSTGKCDFFDACKPFS